MGKKINPVGFRLPALKNWHSRWFANKETYAQFVLEDLKIRRFLNERLKLAGLVSVEIERLASKLRLEVYVTRPGVVIGRGGSGLEELKKELSSLLSLSSPEKNLQLDVVEVKQPELSSRLVASRIAMDLERRMPHRRVAKRAIERVMMSGALGVKIALSGRLGGATISRTEKFAQGKVPLSTIRANIDYTEWPSLTKAGYVGIKVWINKKQE